MKQAELLTLMDSFVQSGLHRMEYEGEGTKFVLERNAPSVTAAVHSPLAMVQSAVPQAPVALPSATQFAAQPVAAPTTQDASNEAAVTAQEVTAPLVGVFYSAAAPGDAPFVAVGDTVEKGQVLCLIEAMKMMNELNSPVRGVVKRILAENEAVVSFGQGLFEVEPC